MELLQDNAPTRHLTPPSKTFHAQELVIAYWVIGQKSPGDTSKPSTTMWYSTLTEDTYVTKHREIKLMPK